MLDCIVYTSTATASLPAEAIGGLIGQARAFNEGHGITGLLIYCDLKFMQLIEGDPAAVGALYERIRRDPRHANIRLLHRGPQARRFFPAWSMALHDAHAVPDAERARLSNFLDEMLSASASPDADGLPAMRLLEAYARTLAQRSRIESALACLPS